MLRSIIISPDAGLATQLENALSAMGEVTVGRTIEQFPVAVDLARTLRTQAPEVVFLSFEAPEKAAEIVRFLEQEAPGVQVIAIHAVCDAQVLRETMRAGVREFLALPFERQTVVDALRNVKDLLERNPPAQRLATQVFSFLPSKAGVGTSTLALNVSAALARRPDSRTLISDFDLNSGMLRFMLKLRNEYCVLDAVEHAVQMDEDLWPQLVSKVGNLEVLHAGRITPNLRIEPAQIRGLIQFMQRNYSSLCFDLSGNLERYSLEIMQESKRVLLVCTPEIPSLHLAREKMTFLRGIDMHAHVSVVLNRVPKKPLLTKEQVEDVLGVPVLRTFANDYFAVNRAVTAGEFIDSKTELGRQFTDFAAELVDQKPVADTAKQKRKFLEMFSVPNPATASTK